MSELIECPVCKRWCAPGDAGKCVERMDDNEPLSSAIARAEAAEAKVRELEPKAAIHDTAVANGWKEQIAFQRAYAERSTLRQQAEGLDGALQQAHADMQAVTIFVTSKERIKEPEGRIWWAERMAEARDRLSAFRASSTGEK